MTSSNKLYKSKKYNWVGAQFKNITSGKADILLNLRSNVTNETHCRSGHIINRRIKIERTKDKILYSKEYEIGSKQVRELIQNSIREYISDIPGITEPYEIIVKDLDLVNYDI